MPPLPVSYLTETNACPASPAETGDTGHWEDLGLDDGAVQALTQLAERLGEQA